MFPLANDSIVCGAKYSTPLRCRSANSLLRTWGYLLANRGTLNSVLHPDFKIQQNDNEITREVKRYIGRR